MDQQAVPLTPGFGGHQTQYGPVGIYKWRNPSGDPTRLIEYGLCFNPLHEDDECLYGIHRYEADALDDPRPVKDGFYAFVAVSGPYEECQQTPGYSDGQWYERGEDGILALTEDPLSVDATGWYEYRKDGDSVYYAKICPVHQLLDDNNGFDGALQDWSHEALGDAIHLFNALFGETIKF